MLPFFEAAIYKPVRNLTFSLQSLLRRDSYKTQGSGSPSRQQKSEESKRWQRLPEDQQAPSAWKSNTTTTGPFQNTSAVKGGPPSEFDDERDAVLLDNINVKNEIDVERGTMSPRSSNV